MTEVEYVVSGFGRKFAAWTGKKIILHGSREYARALIERYQADFRFAGVVSYDLTGEGDFLGLPVYEERALSQVSPDLVVLTERVKHAEKAYRSLRDWCKRSGAALYNMYGLDEIRAHQEAERPTPATLEEWKTLCAPYDCVAFEAADTLLWRPAEDRLEARPQFLALVPWLRSEGKEVAFSLRKSWPEEAQRRALSEYGLVRDEAREVIRREGEDLSFRRLKDDRPGEKILYIGSGLVNEYLLPRSYGLDACFFSFSWADRCLIPRAEKQIPLSYDGGRAEALKAEIEKHDVISFDIFDTLLERKTLTPEDVFDLTEMRAIEAGLPAEGFSALRRHSRAECAMDDIFRAYEWMARQAGWDRDTADRVRAVEWDAERDVILPRQEVVELLSFAKRAGKRVVLTSDMYYPAPMMEELLREKGVDTFDALLISCDFGKSKLSGLYAELIRLAGSPDRILHLGDNELADGMACREAGIPCAHIPSALEMARERGWKDAIGRAKTWTERCLVGLAAAYLFRDPFQNPNLYQLAPDQRVRRYGISVVGPLAAGYLTWLMEKLREHPADAVLFLARDGWLPMRVYEKLWRQRGLPRPVYFYANRHAAFLCRADDEAESEAACKTGVETGLTGEEILRAVYRLKDGDILPARENETPSEYVKRHAPAIRAAAEEAREGYRRYSLECGLKPSETCAVMDLIAMGSTQRFLSFLPYRMRGYYMGKYRQEDPGEQTVEYYLQGDNMRLLTSFIELEGYFSSPEPSQDAITGDGRVILAPEVRSPGEIRELSLAQDAAAEFADEFFRLFYRMGQVVSPAVPEEMYDAEGYHWVEQSRYNDWMKVPIRQRGQQEGEV